MQTRDWAGQVGETWAEEWERTDRSFAALDPHLVTAAADQMAGIPAPRILDIGCGAGGTSLALAAHLSDATLTGIDLSAALAATARERGKGQPRCRFEAADATTWDAEDGFDGIVSRHGVMFFDDPVGALGHIRARAAPGAPLTFSCFRSPALNPWVSGMAHALPASPAADPDAPGPFAFADRARVTRLLEQAGWKDIGAVPIDYDYVAGAGPDPVADAVDFFRRIGPIASALRQMEEQARAPLLDALTAHVSAHFANGRVAFPAAAWIWSARA